MSRKWKYLTVGPAPEGEWAQVTGSYNYSSAVAIIDAYRFRDVLRRILGPEPVGARLCVIAREDSAGAHYEVAVNYDVDSPEGLAYALRATKEAPYRWPQGS